MNRELLIGILASRHSEKTLACLHSLASSSYSSFNVFLVDNGSGEDLAQAVSQYEFVEVHTEQANRGAAAGRNIILKHYLESGSWPYLLFLDNDMVLSPDTLTQTIRYVADAPDELGAVGIPIVYRDRPEVCWSGGGAMIDWGRCWFQEDGQGKGPDAIAKARDVDTIPTAFLLARRKAVEAAGRFMEDYFIYLEDTEWCWAMKRAGFMLKAIPVGGAVHDVSSSLGLLSPRFYYLRTRNRFWFFTARTDGSRARARLVILRDVLLNSCYPELRAGHMRAAVAVVGGILSGLCLPRDLAR